MLSSSDFDDLLPQIWAALTDEPVPSTRYYIEWFLVLGILRHGHRDHYLMILERLTCFDHAAPVAISNITLCMHLGLKLPESMQALFFPTVFHRLMPWMLHNSHMVRMFAIFVFDRLWRRAMERSFCQLENLPEGYCAMASFVAGSDHCQRFLSKLSGEYFLSEDFDPIECYNVQTIFTTLPAACEIAPAEIISTVRTFFSKCLVFVSVSRSQPGECGLWR